MQVPVKLSEAFGKDFEAEIAQFCVSKGWIPAPEELQSKRFLARSVVPHVEKLSMLFNRLAETGEKSDRLGLQQYWKESSNPKNLRLAYFLYFMPSNVFRVASVFSELARLGYSWPWKGQPIKAVEYGSGPASAACGVITGDFFSELGMASQGGYFALIDQDKASVENGREWLTSYAKFRSGIDLDVRTFHRTISITEPLLPRGAPLFQLMVSSYFLNEYEEPAAVVARTLLKTWEANLEQEGLAVLVEPALRVQSRRLLEVRAELLKLFEKRDDFKVLTPCLGSQSCGALAKPDDWCHEEVTWWRPPYFRVIDALAKLDRKTLPFSYLVVTRSRKTVAEILPAIAGTKSRHRLVSPAHKEGRDLEFFICGEEGKRRTRYRPTDEEKTQIDRGSILLDADLHGDSNATRAEKIGKLIS